MKTFYVYILASKSRSLYIGYTNSLESRVYQHKQKMEQGFTSKYNINRLVYYEEFNLPNPAIEREKQLKNWHRQWKINLIESINPDWIDLSEEF